MKDDTSRSRRRARHDLEDLATRCLLPAASVLMRDAAIDAEFDWSMAGAVAVKMAKSIRLTCAHETADLGDEELQILAAAQISEPRGEVN